MMSLCCARAVKFNYNRWFKTWIDLNGWIWNWEFVPKNGWLGFLSTTHYPLTKAHDVTYMIWVLEAEWRRVVYEFILSSIWSGQVIWIFIV